MATRAQRRAQQREALRNKAQQIASAPAPKAAAEGEPVMYSGEWWEQVVAHQAGVVDQAFTEANMQKGALAMLISLRDQQRVTGIQSSASPAPAPPLSEPPPAPAAPAEPPPEGG